MLNAVGVCDALRRLLSRPRLAELAADEDEEPYVLVAHMALANLAACGTALRRLVGAASGRATPCTRTARSRDA